MEVGERARLAEFKAVDRWSIRCGSLLDSEELIPPARQIGRLADAGLCRYHAHRAARGSSMQWLMP